MAGSLAGQRDLIRGRLVALHTSPLRPKALTAIGPLIAGSLWTGDDYTS